MLTYSAHPDTTDDVQTEIVRWFGTRSKEKELPCTFVRTPKESALKIVITSANA